MATSYGFPPADIPSLRRHDPDQVRRSAARCRPLSPMAGSRSGEPMVVRVNLRDRVAQARLYLVCDARSQAFLEAALRGGVDVIQLRDKTLGDRELVRAAHPFRAAADAHGALFILND